MGAGAPLAGGNGATGISGFAFQGTNAHVILARYIYQIRDLVSFSMFLNEKKSEEERYMP